MWPVTSKIMTKSVLVSSTILTNVIKKVARRVFPNILNCLALYGQFFTQKSNLAVSTGIVVSPLSNKESSKSGSLTTFGLFLLPSLKCVAGRASVKIFIEAVNRVLPLSDNNE